MIYSDADCAFFSNPQPVFDEIGDASVMIHEHRFQQCMYRHEDPNNYGKYNVGLMLFRRDDIGLDVLKWWTERNIDGVDGTGRRKVWPNTSMIVTF